MHFFAILLAGGGDKNERLIQICKQLNCNYYISGPSAKTYIDVKAFNENHILLFFSNLKRNRKSAIIIREPPTGVIGPKNFVTEFPEKRFSK